MREYNLEMLFRKAALSVIGCVCAGFAFGQEPATFTLAGDWEVRVAVPGAGSQPVHVAAPPVSRVNAEKYTAIPVFNPKAGGWVKGAQLTGVKAQETTSPQLLEGDSFTLRAGPEPDAREFTRGVDYEIDLSWGTFGRVAGSSILPDQPVFASYRHTLQRLDAVVATAEGRVVLFTHFR